MVMEATNARRAQGYSSGGSAPISGSPGHIKATPYPLEYEQQIDIQDFPKEGLLFVGFNYLRISKEKVIVETRRREEPNGAWQPDARWTSGPKKDPLPRYEIAL